MSFFCFKCDISSAYFLNCKKRTVQMKKKIMHIINELKCWSFFIVFFVSVLTNVDLFLYFLSVFLLLILVVVVPPCCQTSYSYTRSTHSFIQRSKPLAYNGKEERDKGDLQAFFGFLGLGVYLC